MIDHLGCVRFLLLSRQYIYILVLLEGPLCNWAKELLVFPPLLGRIYLLGFGHHSLSFLGSDEPLDVFLFLLYEEEKAFAEVAESRLAVSEQRVQSVQYFGTFLHFFLVVFFFLGVVVLRVGFSDARDVPELDTCADPILYLFNRRKLFVRLVVFSVEPSFNI